MHNVAMHVGEDLDFDMPRPFNKSFDVERTVSKGGLRFASCARDRLVYLSLGSQRLHPDAATAGCRLQQRRQPNPLHRYTDGFIRLLGRYHAWNDRHAGFLHQAARARLRAHALERSGRWANEDEAGRFTRARKTRTFREKAVTRVDGLGLRLAC